MCERESERERACAREAKVPNLPTRSATLLPKMLEGKRQKAEGMKTFVSTTPKVDSEDEDEDGDGYLSFEHGRRKHGTFKATCTRFLSLIFTLVFLGICAAALLFYQVLPSLLPTSRTIRKVPTKLSFFFFRGVCMCVCC